MRQLYTPKKKAVPFRLASSTSTHARTRSITGRQASYAIDANSVPSAYRRVRGSSGSTASHATWIRSKPQRPPDEVDPKAKTAWAEWCERVVAHFRTEPSDGGRSYGVDFPRGWGECEAFFWWFDGMAFEEQSTPELLQKGHETAEAFIAQFCELWFPRYAA